MSKTFTYFIPDTPKNGDQKANLAVDVEYELHAAERGSRGSLGEQLEPDYPAHIEIETTTINGHDVSELVDMDDIEKAILEALER